MAVPISTAPMSGGFVVIRWSFVQKAVEDDIPSFGDNGMLGQVG